MKSLFINIIVALVLAPMFVVASDKKGKDKTEVESAKYTIYYDESHNSFNLVYKTYSTRPVLVFIYNDQQKLIFTDKIHETGILSRPYNFKALKPGTYTFKIVENQREVAHNVVYAPIINKCSRQVNVAPLQANKFELSVMGQSNQPIKVKILDQTKTIVFSETINEENNFSKIYNLEKLNLTKCSFEVSINNEVLFSQSF